MAHIYGLPCLCSVQHNAPVLAFHSPSNPIVWNSSLLCTLSANAQRPSSSEISIQVKSSQLRSNNQRQHSQRRLGEDMRCFSLAEQSLTSAVELSALETDTFPRFPAFLPAEVEEVEEEAARQLAYRIERLPVQTSFSPLPISTGCIPPTPRQTTSADEAASPPVLLLHSFDSSCLEWRRLYPLLEEEGIEAWALDILGWGFTDAGLGGVPISVEAKTEHIYEFWRQHIGRPAIVVGPSLGGAAAIHYALKHPDAVEKLVLIDPQGYTEGLGPIGALPRPLAYAGVSVLKSIWLRSSANNMAYSDPQLATMDAMRVGRLHTFLPAWSDSMVSFMKSGGYNVAARVKEVEKEVLLIWGEDDKILERRLAERFVADLPRCTLRYLPACGHLPHLEKPREVALLIKDFSQCFAP
eukprot:TRINITY_DN23344_c0_g1_i1.p1 TRINITY_DN23344_c0_g1~~TRINITY_DN23344_c0_g1_i1.p1  ORF type:complete len:411 (+),score=47.53 TRINITY_DN23344_c0_g1_i1:336-1568(+)